MCCLVIRMHLNAEILTSVDKLDEQRELITEALVVLLAYEFCFLFAYQLVQTLAFIGAIGHYRLVILYARDFPALSDAFHLSVKMLEGDNLVTSPECLLKQRFEFIHNIILVCS